LKECELAVKEITSAKKMYRLATYWLFLVLVVVWTAKQVTAAAPITQPTALLRARQTQSIISVDSTTVSIGSFSAEEFCDGEGSICDYVNQLSDDCEAFEADGILGGPQWLECVCGNGYVSVNQQ
jgi:hypothetical protein